MRVAFLSSEVAPYSKTGGLGDVAGALPLALAGLGVEVVTLTPLHRAVPREGMVAGIPFLVEGHTVTPWRLGNVVFLDIPEFFDRPALYGDEVDEHRRYALFQLAALGWLQQRPWRPDIIHCNDWQTGLVPALLAGPFADDPTLGGVPTVFTIHNLGY